MAAHMAHDNVSGRRALPKRTPALSLTTNNQFRRSGRGHFAGPNGIGGQLKIFSASAAQHVIYEVRLTKRCRFGPRMSETT